MGEENYRTPVQYGAPEEEAVVTQPVARYFALLAGGGLVTLGILGFIPAISQGGVLLGITHVSTTANIIRLVTGVLGLIAFAMHRSLDAKAYAIFIGVVYLIYFSIGNIDFGNMEGSYNALQKFPWITFNAINAGLMISGWLVAGLAFMQSGDVATREYRQRRRWVIFSRDRLRAT